VYEGFSVTGKRLLEPGFLDVLTAGGADDVSTVAVPAFTAGETITLLTEEQKRNTPRGSSGGCAALASLRVREGQTQPPGYLTESELITLMEKNGIGTDASIPTHITNISKRNYATVGPGRTVVPTPLGIVLVRGYHMIDRDLVLPLVRSEIERQCSLVAKGEAAKDAVVAHALQNFAAKFEYFVNNIARMDHLFSLSFTTLVDSGKPFTRCGKTGRYLKMVESRPQRLYNPFTEEVYNLPQGGEYRISGKQCPVCRFETLLYMCGDRSYPLCPHCFNFPPFEWKIPLDDSYLGKGIVSQCPHPEDHPIIQQLEVGPCPETEDNGGVLILEPKLTDGKWKLVSTRGMAIVSFSNLIHKVRPLSETEATLLFPPKPNDTAENAADDDDEVSEYGEYEGRDGEGFRYFEVEFHKDMSPLEGGKTKYVGSIFFDELLQTLVELKFSKKVFGRGKGKGKGGRRGGKGKGRGKGGAPREPRPPRDPRMSFRDF
jgi:DNA topoisomerase-3